MSWRFLWMLNDWSWGFRIAQMHLDWIRFACFRSFNFFRGADICKYFCNFLHALGQWCFIWFYLVRLPISSSYHCKYNSFKIIRLCHRDHYLLIMNVTYWKHSLTIATSLESNCSPRALLARHTRSNASLSSWGNIWLGWGGQGSKEIRALRSAIPHQENSGIMRFQTIFTLLLLSSCKISPLVSTLGRRSSLEKYWCNIWQRKISHYLRIFYRTFCLESFYEFGHSIARNNWTFCN